ncbi:MAG: flavin reductase family protein [bacterium]
MKTPIDLSLATRLINNGPVIMVTSGQKDKKANIITLAWNMPVSKNPPLVAIALASTHYSTQLIKEYKEFVINIPNEKLLPEVIFCGTKSGRDVDKFAETGLTKERSQRIETPLIGECIGHLECKVVQENFIGDHSIFYGEVLAASTMKGLFNEMWDIGKEESRMIHHLGGKMFYGVGEKK